MLKWEGLGQQLEALAAHANEQIVVVAPFIKRETLQRIVGNAPAATPLLCVTRWRVDELACGVSDLDVWLDVSSRPASRLLLVKDLHAKYFRFDREAVVGSCNVTGAALGFRHPSNLELAVALQVDGQTAVFEATVLDLAVPVTQPMYEHMRRLIETMPSAPPPGVSDLPLLQPEAAEQPPTDTSHATPWSDWLPSCRTPSELFEAYAGHLDGLTLATRASALSDLQHLAPPAGLTRPQFEAFVAGALLSSPLIGQLASFALIPRRFGEMRDLVRELGPVGSSTNDWQTVMRWLLHFASDRFAMHVANYSEIFQAKW